MLNEMAYQRCKETIAMLEAMGEPLDPNGEQLLHLMEDGVKEYEQAHNAVPASRASEGDNRQ